MINRPCINSLNWVKSTSLIKYSLLRDFSLNKHIYCVSGDLCLVIPVLCPVLFLFKVHSCLMEHFQCYLEVTFFVWNLGFVLWI